MTVVQTMIVDTLHKAREGHCTPEPETTCETCHLGDRAFGNRAPKVVKHRIRGVRWVLLRPKWMQQKTREHFVLPCAEKLYGAGLSTCPQTHCQKKVPPNGLLTMFDWPANSPDLNLRDQGWAINLPMRNWAHPERVKPI